MPSRSIVLVTGASKGIGAATAIAFARAGYDVCVNYHSDAEGASATAGRCEAEGAKAIAVGADVSDRNAVKISSALAMNYSARSTALLIMPGSSEERPRSKV